MRAARLLTLIVSTALVAGCQQANGPMPEQDEEVTNRIDDLSRDILNIAGGNQQAPGEFIDDLMTFGEGRAATAVQALGRAITPAFAGKTVSEDGARQVARQVWLVVAGRELSERQREGVLNDLRDALTATGLSPGEIEPVVATAGDTQEAATARPRRWYERY